MALIQNIRLVSVTNNNATQILATSYCHSVQVKEDASVVGWPTVDFTVFKPGGNNNATIPIGGAYTFTAPFPFGFRPGDPVGNIQTVSGTSTFVIDECTS